jgi:Zn-dependent peptidase ImmA (M78 family)
MHEIGHAIFDLESDQVSIDYKREDASDEFKELRAHTFAQECLVPRSVLSQLANRFGIKWRALSALDVATLIAHSHVEQRLLLKAAYDADLLNRDQLESYSNLECASELRQLTSHALSTREYFRSQATEMPKWIAEYRNTDLGRRSLRLPSLYVTQVIDAVKHRQISQGKAAEMLMMDKETFRTRFSSLLDEVENAA